MENRFNTNSTPRTPNRELIESSSVAEISEHWTYRVEPESGTRSLDTYIGPGSLVNKLTGEVIERNRPGSLYVEIDLEGEEASSRVLEYAQKLASEQERNSERYKYAAPEILPLRADIEAYMLNRLLEQNGTLNIWDASNEIMRDDGKRLVYFEEAAASFISNLELDVKFVEDAPEQTLSRRRFLGNLAAIAAIGTANAAALGAQNTEKHNEGLSPVFYTVSSKDSEEGLWGVVSRTYDDMSDAEISEYITSGAFINHTAAKDRRDPDAIRPGDYLELPEP